MDDELYNQMTERQQLEEELQSAQEELRQIHSVLHTSHGELEVDAGGVSLWTPGSGARTPAHRDIPSRTPSGSFPHHDGRKRPDSLVSRSDNATPLSVSFEDYQRVHSESKVLRRRLAQEVVDLARERDALLARVASLEGRVAFCRPTNAPRSFIFF